MKKRLILTCGAVLLASASLMTSRIFGDPIQSPYSNLGDDTIGSWSDEVWDAAAFYQLAPCGKGSDYKYCYSPTKAPSGKPDAYFVSKAGEGSASVPMDLVVTEWATSGHIHFSAQ